MKEKEKIGTLIDVDKLPDYMTYRRQKLNERKNMKINYTLQITQNLPKPDFSKTKAKYDFNAVPDIVETSL